MSDDMTSYAAEVPNVYISTDMAELSERGAYVQNIITGDIVTFTWLALPLQMDGFEDWLRLTTGGYGRLV